MTDLLETLKALISKSSRVSPELGTDIRSLAIEASTLLKERNEVIHHIWGTGSDGVAVTSKFLLSRAESQETARERKLEEVRQLAEKLFYLNMRVVFRLNDFADEA